MPNEKLLRFGSWVFGNLWAVVHFFIPFGLPSQTTLIPVPLREQLLTQKEREKFISISALEQLITPDSVEQCLRVCSDLDGQPVDPAIVPDIVSKAPKLFSILVLLQCEYLVTKLIAEGVFDSIFPILYEDDVSKRLPPELLPSRFRGPLFRQQRDFPLAFKARDHMEIPQNYTVPFLKKNIVNNGTFGVIYDVEVAEGHLLGNENSTGVVVKEIQPNNHRNWKFSMKEVRTLRARQHSNIVPLLASFNMYTTESENPVKLLCLIFPTADMNLTKLMTRQEPPPGWLPDRLYDAIYSIVSALCYIHKEIGGTIALHHDLKPDNILVFGDTLKICDFGSSDLKSSEQGSETYGSEDGLGTFTYIPPEYWNNDGKRDSRRHGRAFDVWSMGCMTVELAGLIRYGWESEPVKDFRDKRSKSQKRPRTFKDRSPLNDYSFHNNMNEVQQYMEQMKDNEENQLAKLLRIADGMLEMEPEDRVYSWEVGLDLDKLLKPYDPNSISRVTIQQYVQPPKKGMNYDDTQTPVHRASIQGDIDRLDILLEKGWPANEKDREGNTPYQLAEQYGHSNVLNYLTGLTNKRGMSQEEMLGRDEFGRTSLHAAAISSNKEAVESILETNSAQQELRVSDYCGRIPLHLASEKSSEEIVSLMLNASGNPEELIMAKDRNGKTPFHFAARAGFAKVVQNLLNAGQDKQLRMCEDQDDNGNIPLDLAISYRHEEVEELLRDISPHNPRTS